VIRDGENGFLVPIDDYASLANRVTDVLAMDEQRWRTMSDAAWATVQQYSWDDAAQLFEGGLVRAIERTDKPSVV
jgi:glycosyltransferase involved in cell wall biosynthesis